MDILGTERNYASLSIRDLLEARDLYHYHLVHKSNVVGTAVGLYLIRRSDAWPTKKSPKTSEAPAVKPPRTLENSEVRDYSWPCILVFVSRWVDADEFRGGGQGLPPEDMVPKTLYLPDGRTVPVCVVQVSAATAQPNPIPPGQWPASPIGGGFPLVSDAQNLRRTASIGCLVTDGHTVYALTNRHVAGPAGTPIRAILRGDEVVIGQSSDKQLTRLPFSEVYSDFPSRRTWLTLDVGLVALNDLQDFTSQVYGLGEAGPLADLSERNISLRLIEARTVAFGAASGKLEGRIKALFYRHRSVGGFDDVSDFLIAPDADALAQTQPGDSGTVWHIAVEGPEPVLRPLALQWGGQSFLNASTSGGYNFALAASLSNVCRLLDVELVREHNTGARPYWGKVGHYSIGAYAVDAVISPKLATLMRANRDRVAFELGHLDPDAIDAVLDQAKVDGGFVPLADVPDIIWKAQIGKVRGGRKNGGNNPEGPTHYADIDQPLPDGRTLIDICTVDPTKISIEGWQRYYDELGHTSAKSRGLLPFRVWQFFDAMVDALRRKDVAAYVCAAGIVAHYVGDACQSLHGSYLNDGYPDGSGKDVHSAYETTMIDNQADVLFPLIAKEIARSASAPKSLANGHEVATAIFALMVRTAKSLPPATIVDAYIETGGGKSRRVTDTLWGLFGKKTAIAMADGAKILALIWDSAWIAGQGDKLPQSKLSSIDKADLQKLYEDPNFVPSLILNDIGPVLK